MKAVLPVLAAAAMLLAGSGVLAQQAQPPATGLIFGRVVEATSGAAVRGATVRRSRTWTATNGSIPDFCAS